MKNLPFGTPCWDASTKYGHNIFVGLQFFAFLSFLFLLSIREDILSIKSRNTLLLNIGRVSLINFVTINLLERFSWVKAFIRANTKYANYY